MYMYISLVICNVPVYVTYRRSCVCVCVYSLCVHVLCTFCSDFVFAAPGSGFNIAGRIDSGHVQVGEAVAVLPVGETATVKSKRLNRSYLVTKNEGRISLWVE